LEVVTYSIGCPTSTQYTYNTPPQSKAQTTLAHVIYFTTTHTYTLLVACYCLKSAIHRYCLLAVVNLSLITYTHRLILRLRLSFVTHAKGIRAKYATLTPICYTPSTLSQMCSKSVRCYYHFSPLFSSWSCRFVSFVVSRLVSSCSLIIFVRTLFIYCADRRVSRSARIHQNNHFYI